MHAVDIYGLSEIMGPGVSANASRPRTGCTSGRIISSEVINPETGPARSRRRKKANWCFTSLTKEAFPIHPLRTRGTTWTCLLAAPRAGMRRRKKSPAAATIMIIPARRQCVPPRQIEEALDGDTRTRPHFQIRAEQTGTGWIRCACCANVPTPRWRTRPVMAAAQQLAAQDQETVASSVQIDWRCEQASPASKAKPWRIHRQPPQRLAAAARLQTIGAHATTAVDLDL